MITLTLAEAADLLKLSGDALLRKARAGTVPGARIGRRWVFIRDDLLALIREQHKARVMTSAPARLGRPPRADRAQVRARINVTLPRDVADYLTELGDGNRSQAIVELARGTTLLRSTLRGMCPPAST